MAIKSMIGINHYMKYLCDCEVLTNYLKYLSNKIPVNEI